MRKPPTGLVGMPYITRCFVISTTNKRCPLSHRTKCTARTEGGASVEREIELDISVSRHAVLVQVSLSQLYIYVWFGCLLSGTRMMYSTNCHP